jgi:hypothetical protein
MTHTLRTLPEWSFASTLPVEVNPYYLYTKFQNLLDGGNVFEQVRVDFLKNSIQRVLKKLQEQNICQR